MSADGPGALAQAERTSGLVFVASRAGQLAFSGLMLVNDRRRFTNPRGQALIWAALAGEAVWLGRRIVRAGCYDDRAAMWFDTASSATALVISQRGLSAGAAPWAKNIAIGSAIGAAASARNSDAAGALATLCAAAVATGLRSRGRDAHAAGLALAVNDAVSWSGMAAAARVYLVAHRRYAQLRDEADELAVDRSAAAAAQAERGRQHEVLHRITIEVLRRIAASTDVAQARLIARAEASRLRYALRTEGRLPQGLDEVLASAADQAAERGVQVELVTAELIGDPGPAAVVALQEAIAEALVVAGELGQAHRVVVRAYGGDDEVGVTLRDHGGGFDPDVDGPYRQRIGQIVARLEQQGGSSEVWSEPGSGVRLALTVPSADGGDDDAPDGVPDGGVRVGPAGDRDRRVVDNDVEVGGRGRLVDSQSDVGIGVGSDDRPGVGGDAFEPRAQQRAGRRDVDGWWHGHLSSVTARLRERVGVSTQFRDLAPADTRQADRTLLAALVTWRASGLLTGAAALVGGARQRSRPVAVLTIAAGLAESIWFARRAGAGDRWADPTGSAIDAATAATLLGVSQRNLAPVDRVTWMNWVPWSFAENVICGQAMAAHPLRRRIAGGALVAAAHLAQGPRLGDRVANGVAHTAFFTVAAGFADQIRSGAVRLERARASAVAEGDALAEVRERAVQLRVLHDRAVQTLEAIGTGRYADHDAIRSAAEREADYLERELIPSTATDARLADVLAALAAEKAAEGLRVDVVVEPRVAVPAPVAVAMGSLCREALTNVVKHAKVGVARVELRRVGARLELIISDDGVGFDPVTIVRGFGTVHSIQQRMSEVGGRAAIDSAPGRGTRVVAQWPA